MMMPMMFPPMMPPGGHGPPPMGFPGMMPPPMGGYPGMMPPPGPPPGMEGTKRRPNSAKPPSSHPDPAQMQEFQANYMRFV